MKTNVTWLQQREAYVCVWNQMKSELPAALPFPPYPGKSFHYQLICFPYDSRHSRLYEMSQER